MLKPNYLPCSNTRLATSCEYQWTCASKGESKVSSKYTVLVDQISGEECSVRNYTNGKLACNC